MIEKIKNNKKYIIICTLFFCFCVGITLALSSSVGNSLTNSFTLGSVETEIKEDDPEIHGDHIDKRPYVENTGTNSALIRMRVTISPTELIEKYNINLVINDNRYDYDSDEDKWQNTGNCWIYNNDDDYYYYTGVVNSGEKTEPLFTKVTGKEIIDDNGGIIKELEGLEIAVYYESIQNVARADDGTEIIANTGDINNKTVQQLWSIFDSQN